MYRLAKTTETVNLKQYRQAHKLKSKRKYQNFRIYRYFIYTKSACIHVADH